MSGRLPLLTPAELLDQQQVLYAEIVGGERAADLQLFRLTDRAGRLKGPFNAMLHAPDIGFAIQRLGAAIRFHTQLTDRSRELAILTTANTYDSEFERYAHEALGKAVGITDAELHALGKPDTLVLSDPIERATLTVVRLLLSSEDLDDQEFSEARSLLGIRTLVEIAALVGYYRMIAMQLRLFRVGVSQGTEDE